LFFIITLARIHAITSLVKTPIRFLLAHTQI